MKSPRWLQVLMLFWSIPFTGLLAGGASFTPHGLDSEIVDMEIRSFLNGVPERGFMDFQIEIRNRMNREGRWEFDFFATDTWGDANSLRHTRSIPVEALSMRTVRIRVPVFPATESSYTQNPRIPFRIFGPGVPSRTYDHFRSVGKQSPNVIRSVYASEGVTISRTSPEWDWVALEKAVQDHNFPLVFLEMDSELFPDDHAGLIGADILLMQASEWEALSAGSTKVTEAWIAQGGILYLVGNNSLPTETFGLGQIRFLPAVPGEMKPIADQLSGVENPSLELLDQGKFSEKGWELRSDFPNIQKPIGILIVAVIAIAGILGPLNMMVAFRKRASLQLLWTTPLLSVGISFLVGLAILLGDGIGGNGIRAQRVLILPGQQVEVAWQEQVSRTGVLFRNGFELEEGWWIKPVALTQADTNRPTSYMLQADGSHEGDWFGNRRLQAQVLQRTQSTRAEVSVHWEKEVPIVTSTVETPFTTFIFRDAQNTLWSGSDISPGKSVRLKRLDRKDGGNWQDPFRLRKNSLFPPNEFLAEKGWFYAEGADPGRMVDTLKTVNWENHSVWFFGPVVEGAP